MGRDKASLPFGGETLLARVVRMVRQAADDVVLVAREGQTLPEGFEVVRDPAEGLGPLAGLMVGLRYVKADRAFVTACDVPFLRPALIERLIDLGAGYDVAVPFIDGHLMMTTAVYARSIAPVVEALVERRTLRARDLLDHVRARRIHPDELREVDPDLESFRTCNTPESYAAALRQAGLT
jgi:molybdopterin-guanine dinucleotide biosynthesis protein A